VGVAYWVGAFYPLARIARGADLPRIARIMKRFGDLAVVAVGGLIAAGALLLWLMLETPLALFESIYGRLMAVKLLLVAGLLSLAAMNKLRLTPALFAGDALALRRLRNSIGAEMTLATVVLAVTAAFTTIVGPPALE
jgi:putative copper export protein